jgi:hypothetical protein
MTTQTAIRAATFDQSVGVQVHLRYSDSKYWNTANVIADLKYLGITQVRDTVWNVGNGANTAEQAHYAAVASAGIHFDMLVESSAINSSLALLDSLMKTNPGAITSIEGPNEVNNAPVTYNGQTGVAGAVAQTNALTAAVHADPIFKGVPVYNVTSYPDIGTNADVGNFHAYPIKGAQPFATLSTDLASQQAVMPGKPLVITEAGYYTMTNGVGWGGVDYATQAKLTLNMIMDATKLGVSKIYLYQLLDAYADPTNKTQEDHFGLFDINNQPKPAATAIHNLLSILSDPGTNAQTFTPTTLNYSISGLPTTGSSLEIAKSSGAHDIVVWAEPQIWNNTTHTEVAAPNSTVQVNLGATYADVSVYDPLTGTTAASTLHNVSSVTLNVTDHPLIIEVGPNLTPAAVTPAVQTTVTPAAPTSVHVATAAAPSVTSAVTVVHPTVDFLTTLGLPHGSLAHGLLLH